MEGPVKERLTGAVILLAALVIVVPEMLSGPEPAPRDNAAQAESDAGPPLRTYSLVLNASPDQPVVEQSTLAPQPAAAPAAAQSPAPVAASEPAPESAREPAPATPPERAAVAAVTPPAAREPARPAATAPAPAAAGGWWTQLGSFSSRDNAERLAQQLRAAGYAIQVSRVSADGKDLHRVRAGPVRSRDEALVLQQRLAAAGHKSTLVAP